MPFIVTTKRPEHDGDTHHWCGFGPDHDGPCPPLDEAGRVVSQLAVATLEEAAGNVVGSVMDTPAGVDPLGTLTGQRVLSWDGLSTLRYPLPDGTLIEVEPIERAELIDALGLPAGHVAYGDTAAIIAAFNAPEAAIPGRPVCPECNGTGVDPMDRGERCILCKGRPS